MPLNNSINKTSDTFLTNSGLGTVRNITAGFTSLRPTYSSANVGTVNVNIGNLSQSTDNGLCLEYISDDVNGFNYLCFNNAGGTLSSPTSAPNNAIYNIFFDRRGAGGSYLYTNVITVTNRNNGNHQLQFFSDGNLSIYSPTSPNTLGYLQTDSLFNLNLQADKTSPPLNFSVSSFPTNNSGAINIYTQSSNSTESNIGLCHQNYSDSTNIGASFVLGRSRSSNVSFTTKVEANDEIGQLIFAGSDTTTTAKQLANIKCFADGATAANDLPGRIVFSTTPDASATPSETMRLDNAGRVTQIRQPSFSASLSADVANATGDGTAYTIAFNTEQYDQGTNFAANTFTAPIAGKYRFAYTISVDDLLVGHTKMVVEVGGRVVERCNPYALADSDGFYLCSGMVDLSLAASATVTMVVTITGSTKTVTVKGTTTSGTFLSGQLQV